MTLHLAASFSRDAPLLGLCFAFTALLLDAAFGPEKQKALSPARLALLLGCGVLLAPGKLVYLPLAALLLVVPAARLGRHAKAKKCGYLAICLALALLLNTGLLADTLHSGVKYVNGQKPVTCLAEVSGGGGSYLQEAIDLGADCLVTVSYTHLTLPTKA